MGIAIEFVCPFCKTEIKNAPSPSVDRVKELEDAMAKIFKQFKIYREDELKDIRVLDHACIKCDGSLVIDGFLCGYHKAEALTGAEKRT